MEIRFTSLLRWQETGSLKRTRRCKGSQAQDCSSHHCSAEQMGGLQTYPLGYEGMEFAEVSLASEEVCPDLCLSGAPQLCDRDLSG